MAKATIHFRTDVDVRRHGYQMGLETPVVHADNDECWIVVLIFVCAVKGKILMLYPR